MNVETGFNLQSDYEICKQVMLRASKNYSFAAKMLSADKKPYIESLYAFLRIGDDFVDVNAGPFSTPREGITYWQREYWRCLETGKSNEPVMRAYCNTVKKFSIPAEIMIPYFRAMLQDTLVTRYETFNDLLEYMKGSSLVVGQAMTYILGTRQVTIAEALPFADSLSIAMQLSNFIRDIDEDWQRKRLYIPLEDLRRFEIDEDVFKTRIIDEPFKHLLQWQIKRADSYFEAATGGIKLLATGRWAVGSALEIYRAILRQVELMSYNVFAGRASTSKLEKLALLAKAALKYGF